MKKTVLSAAVVVFGVLLLHSLAQAVTLLGEEPPTDEQKQMIRQVFDCLPTDKSESAVFTLVERDGGQYLSCKRFKKIEQTLEPKSKSGRLTIAMGDAL